LLFAPFSNPSFRPEEEHVASGEYNIVPPLGCWNKAVENPVGRPWAVKTYLQTKWLAGLLATGMNYTRALKGSANPESIPGAVGEVPLSTDFHDVLCRDAGERRCHPD